MEKELTYNTVIVGAGVSEALLRIAMSASPPH